jgi:hypothetical protein
MKITKMLKSALIVLAISLAASALAAEKGSLHVSSTLKVAGEQLAAGDYTLGWIGSGPSVDLTIMQGKRLVTTVPATMALLNDPPSNDAIVITIGVDGTRWLSQIMLSGRSFSFDIAPGSDTAKPTANH